MNKSEIITLPFAFINNDKWSNIALWSFLSVTICVGVILQLFVLRTIVTKRTRNGLVCFLLQLIIADSVNFFLCYFDTSFIFSQKWTFGEKMCNIFYGLTSFISAVTTYLFLTMNLHAITTANLALDAHKTIKSKEENCNFINEEVESISTTYDSLEQKRTLTIDYSGPNWKTSINVLFPNVLVWVLSFSVSIPTFIFSRVKSNSCEIDSNFDNDGIKILIILFKIACPLIIFLISIFILLGKLKLLKKFTENFIDEDPIEIIRITLVLTILFIFFQFPKIIYASLSRSAINLDYYVSCILCVLYYFTIILRSLVFICIHRST
ncbi:hypothetical protein PVAND_005954 [Polypedilum vanderplanki]|uniref:G-protein coupled receptors family 1 profile domain-containing protein n=1 Tax=Polypedilum vanderplanki TaxID=319348 RepID=A0A9J6C1P9_POLVA|nr:hypothetical protein PVAND_005954 [Polypedilum vanderplanki]